MTDYKLADGSLSTDYEVGDAFTISIEGCEPTKITCTGFSGEWCQTTSLGDLDIKWQSLTPTPETKRKVEERKRYAEEAADAIANQRGHINREEANSIADAVSKARREGLIITAVECNKDDGTVKCTTKPMDKAKPLARIVDWRGGDEVKRGDIIVMTEGRFKVASSTPRIAPSQNAVYTTNEVWAPDDEILHVIRINTDALPKQRTLTRAEAEKEFGVRIAGD